MILLILLLVGLFLLFRYDIKHQLPNKGVRLGIISSGVFIFFIGSIFRIMHWPGASISSLLGTLLIIVGLIIRIVVKPIKQENSDI